MLNDLFGSKVDASIERLQGYEPLTKGMGYYLAFSGGKDSCAILALAKMAGVKFDAHYSMTTIDPPELYHFIRTEHPEVMWHRPEQTFLQKVVTVGIPNRMARWCCEYLKEGGGDGRVVLTGVRWAESAKRAKRRMTETCYRDQGKQYLHPIIDWSDQDVWEFIRGNNIKYCSLYDEGKKRIGCLFCPNASAATKAWESKRYPKFAAAFVKAFQKLKDNRTSAGKTSCDKWKDGQEMFDWWISNKSCAEFDNDKALSIFEDVEITDE